jgi:hypothetical protein
MASAELRLMGHPMPIAQFGEKRIERARRIEKPLKNLWNISKRTRHPHTNDGRGNYYREIGL